VLADDEDRELREVLLELDADLARQQEAISVRRNRLAMLLDGLRAVVLVGDVYGIVFGLALGAACVTRPHVVTPDELRIRYGGYFDLLVPRDLIASVGLSRNYNASSTVAVAEGRLSVAVSSQTNVIVKLTEPIMLVRPLGRRAEATTIRFFADDPSPVLDILRSPQRQKTP
jgi:hypothetical protein